MSLIIDGYNLIHAAGIMGRGVGPGSLQRARHALVRILAASVEPAELARTVVVFDASDPDIPPGLPRTTTLEGITVHYAADYDDADELIEELIRRDSAPRQLTVVSSDHRLQRAARRRRATAIDSDVWFGQLLQQRRERAGEPVDFAKPLGEVSQHEVLYWLKEFGLEADGEIARSADTSTLSNNPDIPDGDTAAADETREPPEHEKPPAGDHWDNIFPPGYGDDLLDETD